MKVPILLPNIFDHPFTYENRNLKSLEVGDFVKVPLVANGGAFKFEDIVNLFDNTTATAVSCGTMFVFFGPRNAVLINYPEKNIIEKTMNRYE